MIEKVCTSCGISKPATQEFFYAKPKGKYGLNARCKPCLAARVDKVRRRDLQAVWRAGNRDRLRLRHAEWRAAHPERMQEIRDKWIAEHPAAAVESGRRKQLAKYGITLEQYEATLYEQGGVCAVCDQPPKSGGSNLAVDHDHTSGAFRGLLCKGCNWRIGRVEAGRTRYRVEPWLTRAKLYLAA